MIEHSFPPIPMPWTSEVRTSVLECLESVEYGRCEPAFDAWDSQSVSVGPGLEMILQPFPMLRAHPSSPGPWPTIVGLNFDGNHTLAPHESIPISPQLLSDSVLARGSRSQTWPIEKINEAGWAVITAFVGDVEPDDVGRSSGNAIARWAAGIRAMARQLENDSRFDRNRVVALGHSRLGKAALLATGADESLAGVVAIQSGCGGAAPSRTNVGETVRDITRTFPHWFAPSFSDYANAPESLPFDQHWLLALCASRPLLLCNASEDDWANPSGQHEMLRLAARVQGVELPLLRLGTTVGNELAHHFRLGKHEVLAEDWNEIFPWLKRWFPPKSAVPA